MFAKEISLRLRRTIESRRSQRVVLGRDSIELMGASHAALDSFSWASPRPEIRSANLLVRGVQDLVELAGRERNGISLHAARDGCLVADGREIGAGYAE